MLSAAKATGASPGSMGIAGVGTTGVPATGAGAGALLGKLPPRFCFVPGKAALADGERSEINVLVFRCQCGLDQLSRCHRVNKHILGPGFCCEHRRNQEPLRRILVDGNRIARHVARIDDLLQNLATIIVGPGRVESECGLGDGE